MTTLLFKRMFNFSGKDYIYKIERTAPNEIQKVFGRVEASDKNNRLDFLPKTGLTHKLEYDHFSGRASGFEKMVKSMDDFGEPKVVETESVHTSNGKFPFWVTLKGNNFETAYVKSDDVKKINTPNIQTRLHERDYEGKPIGYDRTYSNNQGDILEYSYFPNLLDPRTNSLPPAKDTLDESSILEKADRLINRLKHLQKTSLH